MRLKPVESISVQFEFWRNLPSGFAYPSLVICEQVWRLTWDGCCQLAGSRHKISMCRSTAFRRTAVVASCFNTPDSSSRLCALNTFPPADLAVGGTYSGLCPADVAEKRCDSLTLQRCGPGKLWNRLMPRIALMTYSGSRAAQLSLCAKLGIVRTRSISSVF